MRKTEHCVYCRKVLNREVYNGISILVDSTGGDVCGSYDTYGNEPHVSDLERVTP